MYDLITEKLISGSNPIRRGPTGEKVLYLTFDDGPDADFTRRVLEVLREKNAKATFFLVAQKARKHADVVKQIVAEGHKIGNHSLDHSYGVLFSSQEALAEWVGSSEDQLKKLSGQPTVGFRPPNGIMTRHLLKALKGLNQPLILWNRRFFETLLPWRRSPALSTLEKLQAGDIILLHDTQRPFYRKTFLKTLSAFISQAQSRGWKFESLPPALESILRQPNGE
jgi:peptidoglycan/xylan/chitin deacetylase (PgdA/CDA1 family)